jgi:hypothetical protein
MRLNIVLAINCLLYRVIRNVIAQLKLLPGMADKKKHRAGLQLP